MSSNQFTDIYKRLSDEKLIDIIDNKKDYQLLAIETAILELKSRQLSDEQIKAVRQTNEDIKNRKEQSDKKIKEKIEFAKNTTDKTLTILDPLVEKTPDRTIKLICLILGLLALIKLISNFSLTISIFTEPGWDVSVTFFFFDLLFLPISLILLWRKKKSGRIMLSIWLIYNLLSAFSLFYLMFSTSGHDSPLSVFLPQTDISTFTFTLLISVGLLHYINKKDIRTLFK